MATLKQITAAIELAESVKPLEVRDITPQQLPDKLGVMACAADRMLEEIGERSVVCGSWAVWRHGNYARCCSFDLDIVLQGSAVEPFVACSAKYGFTFLEHGNRHWARLRYEDTPFELHVVPEGSVGNYRYIPSPYQLGAKRNQLTFAAFAGLIHLKIIAERAVDDADVIELVRANWKRITTVEEYFSEHCVHGSIQLKFNALVARAYQQEDR